MECKIRKWKIDDAAELAATLNNKNIQDNLRDGLPYPYTEDDAKYYIRNAEGCNEQYFLPSPSPLV